MGTFESALLDLEGVSFLSLPLSPSSSSSLSVSPTPCPQSTASLPLTFVSRLNTGHSSKLSVTNDDRSLQIPDRAQYKHVVFGPSRWETDPERDFHFPAIRQLVEDGDWEEARKRVGSTAGIIRQAAAVLEPPA
jgi:hypothetical protein